MRLEEVFTEAPELLLLDEPTRDLDTQGIAWLREVLGSWDGGLLVASHREAILSLFDHFFVVEESGCRYFAGSFEELRSDFADRGLAEERRYTNRLKHLEASERRNESILRRRRRKKNLGRIHELGRNPSRAQLGAKTSYAQGSQGRAAKIRAHRTAQERAKGVLLRRSLHVDLALSAVLPVLSDVSQTVIDLEDVALYRGGTLLFEGLDLRMGRQRVAVMGENGTGKTSLFEVAVGERRPSRGRAFLDRSRIGVIAQGAENWQTKDSLLSILLAQSSARSAEELAKVLGAHRFPLGLAERPFYSLSPGERTRAALIALCYRPRPVEVLALDEPTGSLDFLGIDSLTASLRAWRGGLLVVSHDEEFLQNIGMDRYLSLRRQPKVMATERQVHQKEKS